MPKIKKAECLFPGRPAETAELFDRQQVVHSRMEHVAVSLRAQAERRKSDIPEDVRDAYWKIWWYLECPDYCFNDV